MATLDQRRRRYEQEVRGLRAVADSLLAEGASEEAVARELVRRRNDLKLAVRVDDPAPIQKWAEKLNQNRYGNCRPDARAAVRQVWELVCCH
jgi:hypothetical protein